MKVEDIAKLISPELKESLSEDSLQSITEAFNNAVETKVNERVNLAVASAEENFNEEVKERLVNLVNKIEEAHKVGLMKVVKSLKENYQYKIKCVRNYYNKQVIKESADFKNALIDSVDRYLDKSISKYAPFKQLKKAVRNTNAMKVLEGFKRILSVDEASSDECVRQSVLEGYNMLKKSKANNRALKNQKSELIAENAKLKTKILLESKLEGLPNDAKKHLRRVLKDADAKFINENFDYSLKLFKDKKSKERELLRSRTVNNRPQPQQVTLDRLVENRSIGQKVTQNEIDQLAEMIDRDEL